MGKTVFYKKGSRVIEATVKGESGDNYAVEYWKFYPFLNGRREQIRDIIPKSKCIESKKG